MVVLGAHLDNVSFHSEESVARWKFVFHRRSALERELGKEALECKEVVKLIKSLVEEKSIVQGHKDNKERLTVMIKYTQSKNISSGIGTCTIEEL